MNNPTNPLDQRNNGDELRPLEELVMQWFPKIKYPSYNSIYNRCVTTRADIRNVRMNHLSTTLFHLVVNQDSEVMGNQFATNGTESRLNTCVRMAIFLGDLVLCPPEINFSEGSEDVPHVYERINPVSTGTYQQTMGNHPFFADRDLWQKPNDSESKYSLWGLGRWIGIDREHECFEEKFLKVCEDGSWEMQLMRFPLILEFMWKSGTGKWCTAMTVHHKPRGLLFRIGNVLGGENDELEMKCWSIPSQFDESMTELSADEIKGAIARTLTGKLFPRNTAKRGGGTISKCGMNLRRGLKVIDAYCLMINNPKYSVDGIDNAAIIADPPVDGIDNDATIADPPVDGIDNDADPPVGGDTSDTSDGKNPVESETESDGDSTSDFDPDDD